MLTKELGIDEAQVRKRVNKISSIERVKTNVEKEVGDKIREYQFAGVKVDEDFRRFYPYGGLASRVLGFTGGDNQGIIGLEVRYEDYLKGSNGRILTTTDARGIELEGVAEDRVEPVPGNDLLAIARAAIADPPVLVLDEAGQFVIPVLSGHLGGANELAQQIAESLHSAAVVTTATDVNGLFAVDVFARKNGLRVCNPEAIRHVSGKLLQGEIIVMAVDPACMSPEEMAELQPPKEVKLISWNEAQAEHAVDVWITKKEPQEDRKTLVLAPKTAVLGMGCRKNKSYNEIKQMIKTMVDSREIDLDDIYALASVDVKEKEPGLQELAQHLRVPFVVFSAGELKKVPGDFTASAFVAQTVGVDNVCERAAVAAADGGSLLIHKQAMDGVTIAVAKREKIVLQFV